MSFIRWLIRVISGLTQFALYSLLFFVLMVGAGYWVALQFFGGEETKAPDLGSLSVIQALEKLQPLHISLELERIQPHVQVPEGHIISQFPAPGAVIKTGTPIRVVLSSGSPLVPIPDLRGSNKIEAGIRLRKIGLDVGNIAMIPREGVAGGTVLATDPPAGAGTMSGSMVNLLLAAGDQAVGQTMPNLIGLSQEEAAEVLQSYQLKIGETREARAGDDTTPVGHVHSQIPAPGEALPADGNVIIIVQPVVENTAPAVGEGGWPSSFYREGAQDPNVFRGNDESTTFRGNDPLTGRATQPPPETTPSPEPESVPPVEQPAEAAPPVNIEFGQKGPNDGQ